MERALRKLLRAYPIVRNWTTLSNYGMPSQPIQNVAQVRYSMCLTGYAQRDIKPRIEEKCVSNDVKIAYNPVKILDAVAVNYTNISMRDALGILGTLFRASKEGYAKSMDEINKHVGFIRLCEVINRDIRLMKTGDIINSLKILTYMGIPNDTLLIQSLLQTIRTMVNGMSIQDIIFMVFLLNKMDSTPLRDALLIALPLVFEAQLPTKLDTDNVVVLTSSLRFMMKHNINNPELQNIVFKSLLKHKDTLDVQTATSILYSLYSMPHLSLIAMQVLSNVQNNLTTNAKGLDVQVITKMLNKVAFAAAENKDHEAYFYNETMIDALVNSTISSNVAFTNGIEILRSLNELNYVHMPFLEYLSAKCFETPDLLRDAPYAKVYVFLEGSINADYKPVFWDTIRDAILANEIEYKCDSRSLIKFALYLTALDCYSPNLLNKVFSQDVKNCEYMKNAKLLLLYQAVKTLYPMYNGPWPSEKILEYATKISTASVCSFRAALERALGGPQYVYNDVRTKLGHHVDHVVVMRKGGYPVAINTATSDIANTIYIEDILTPNESQMILIFNLPDSAYAINSRRVKSTWLLKMRSIETLIRSDTIAINSSSWMKLPEHERVPYLMQAIKLKCEDLSVSEN